MKVQSADQWQCVTVVTISLVLITIVVLSRNLSFFSWVSSCVMIKNKYMMASTAVLSLSIFMS